LVRGFDCNGDPRWRRWSYAFANERPGSVGEAPITLNVKWF
jgi:hypothetical protein